MKTRLFLSLLALIFAVGVLGISLMDAHSVSSNGGKSSSDKELYFDKEMLPDHLFYPLFMIVDRVHLETAPKEERPYLEIEYANRRLLAGEELLDLKKEGLSVTTFTKAEKYLYDAAQDYKQQHGSDAQKTLLIKIITYHMRELKKLDPQLTDANRSVVDASLIQDQILLDSLK